MELFERFEGNPILTKEDFPDDWSVDSVLNPGVGDRDGKTLLFVRMKDREGISRLVCFCSQDGKTGWEIDKDTLFIGEGDEKEKNYGVEDPRLTWISILQEWAIAYTHCSADDLLVNIATTKDFRKYLHLGNVLSPNNKDAALFPEPINGYWWLIHRPNTGKRQIWICQSECTGSTYDDFCRWGGHKILLPVDGTPRWDGSHIGSSAPPLKTDDGRLLLYHGMERTGSGVLYRLGLAMLALDDPTKVTHRTREFIMSPQESYELIGNAGGAIIFPCGWRIHDDGNIRLYYGAADSVICLAESPFTKVMDRILKDPV